MQKVAKSVRLGVVLAVLIALIGMSPILALAQDDPESATPQAVPPAASSTSVGVSCTYDAALNESACTFSASSETGVVDALIVPAGNLCAPVVASSGSATGDGGYRIGAAGGNPSLTILLQGFVQTAGAGSYVIETGGTTQSAGGSGLTCVEAAPSVSVESTDESQATSPPSDLGTPNDGTPPESTDTETSTESDEEADTGDGEAGEASASGTPVVVPPPVSDGTGEPAGEVQTAETDEVEAAALVTIPISVYNCDEADDTADPAADCTPAQGIAFDVTVDGVSLAQVVTDFTGTVTIDAEEGSTVVIEEVISTVPANYVPLGGHQTIDPVAAGATALFLHLLVDGEETGNLQIVNGSCPTSDDEPSTEFNVIGPRTFAGAASSCMPTTGAVFTIESDLLPGGQLVVQTGSDGSWRGTLPAGDYTVIDDSGASADLTVEPDSVTVVVVVDYVPQPEGTLTVTRFFCTEGDVEGTTITVDDTPGSGGPACGPGDGDMRLSEASDGTGGAAEDFTLGADGEAAFELRAGQYLLTDLDTGASATVDVVENAKTAATVREVVLTGRAVVRHIYCDDPAYGDIDPANYAAFADGCGRPYAGMPLTLIDSGGNAVSTDTGSGGGIIVWSQLVPGGYGIAGGADVCAIFAEGIDARSGFAVSVGNSTNLEVYSCASPSSGNPDDGTGGNTGGPGGPGGSGDGTGGGSPNGVGGLYVTQLPSTGVADLHHRSTIWLGFLGSALVLVAALGANRVRRQYAYLSVRGRTQSATDNRAGAVSLEC